MALPSSSSSKRRVWSSCSECCFSVSMLWRWASLRDCSSAWWWWRRRSSSSWWMNEDKIREKREKRKGEGEKKCRKSMVEVADRRLRIWEDMIELEKKVWRKRDENENGNREIQKLFSNILDTLKHEPSLLCQNSLKTQRFIDINISCSIGSHSLKIPIKWMVNSPTFENTVQHQVFSPFQL